MKLSEAFSVLAAVHKLSEVDNETAPNYSSYPEAAQAHNLVKQALIQTTLPRKRGRPARAVVDVSSGVVYESSKEAAKALGIKASNISHHLRGRSKTVAGTTFKYHQE